MFLSTFKVKVKGQRLMTNDCLLIYERLSANIWAYAGIIENKYLTLIKMKLKNDLEYHFGKVKVISSKLTEKSTKAARKHHNCSETNGIWTHPGIDNDRNNLGAHYLVKLYRHC